ncbi:MULTISPECIES: hypothetical protein [unclassified Caballeronia]|uniref:hypothetical protein n=1 Tax=unclassified Caballeronia TaxID=2646786 RepID=UPI00285A7448|nr:MULTISPECIES: hypothetical protein [unclassified Caballeronia]MDR5752839.1 hypothetical protein [Caballeronia sp. LZ024]MDR5841483.1 hypothetical protein [Caballeronia sp. LZ031]
MEIVIVAAIVVVALGAFATFTIADLLPPDVAAKAEEHGRFAGLASESAQEPSPSVALVGGASARRDRTRQRRQVRTLSRSDAPGRRALRRLAR